MRDAYEITIDRTGSKFCGYDIEWNYAARHVDMSMPRYVTKALSKLQHLPPQRQQYAPHKWIARQYGSHSQLVPPDNNTSTLPESQKKFVQQAVGCFLYYGRAVDSTILPAVNEISMDQSKPTKATKEKTSMLLDYLHTHPKAKIRFLASEMQLHLESDAAYLVAQGSKSRVGGYFYLGRVTTPQYHSTTINSPTHVEYKVLKHVVSSAAEAETAGIFVNCCTALDIRNMLCALGHQQGPVKVQTENSTAVAFSTNKLKAKRSKSWDMRLHWLQDRVQQNQFCISWGKGSENRADYFTMVCFLRG